MTQNILDSIAQIVGVVMVVLWFLLGFWMCYCYWKLENKQ
jgi:hypothetical protein